MILAFPTSFLFLPEVLLSSILVHSLFLHMNMRFAYFLHLEPGLIKVSLSFGWFYPTSLGISMVGAAEAR